MSELVPSAESRIIGFEHDVRSFSESQQKIFRNLRSRNDVFVVSNRFHRYKLQTDRYSNDISMSSVQESANNSDYYR